MPELGYQRALLVFIFMAEEEKNPKYLYHYTSVDVLCKLFTEKRDESLVFHASSLDSMNDSAEYMAARNQCKDVVELKLMETILGLPFALCFSESANNIPMWSMYAKGGKGVCLKFNFEKMKNYFDSFEKKSTRKMNFQKCSYLPIEPDKKDIKPFNAVKEYPDTEKLCKEMVEKAFKKPDTFIHEQEWRFLVWQSWIPEEGHKILFKEKQDVLCPYIEIPIPINYLEGIILQPNASEQMIEATRLLQANYGEAGRYISVNVAKISLKIQ